MLMGVWMWLSVPTRAQQHRRKNCDDGDDDQKLNQSKCGRSSPIVLQTALLTTRFNSASGELAGHWLPETITRLCHVVDGSQLPGCQVRYASLRATSKRRSSRSWSAGQRRWLRMAMLILVKS